MHWLVVPASGMCSVCIVLLSFKSNPLKTLLSISTLICASIEHETVQPKLFLCWDHCINLIIHCNAAKILPPNHAVQFQQQWCTQIIPPSCCCLNSRMTDRLSALGGWDRQSSADRIWKHEDHFSCEGRSDQNAASRSRRWVGSREDAGSCQVITILPSEVQSISEHYCKYSEMAFVCSERSLHCKPSIDLTNWRCCWWHTLICECGGYKSASCCL